jgi:hypothetical protein
MKKCPRCSTEKELSEFHNASGARDGKQGHCKACKAQLGKVYELKRDKAKKKQYGKNEWQSKKNNPKYIEYRKKWIEDNKDDIAQKSKEYRDKNRILLLPHRSNQRAKKRGIEGKISMHEWKAALNLTNFMCIACEESVADSIDHVVSFTNGGTNTYDNIQPMCLRCNLKKGTKEVDFRPRGFAESIKENCRES